MVKNKIYIVYFPPPHQFHTITRKIYSTSEQLMQFKNGKTENKRLQRFDFLTLKAFGYHLALENHSHCRLNRPLHPLLTLVNKVVQKSLTRDK